MSDSRPQRFGAWESGRHFSIAALIVSAIIVSMSPALAQDGRLDLSAGYLNVIGSMHGANIQVTVRTAEQWSLVGEFNGASGTDCADCAPEYQDVSVLGGVRFAWRTTDRVSPFWQMLAGGLHSSAADHYVDYCCGRGPQLEPGYSVNYFAFQPGGGVTVMLTPRFGVRAQADVQFAITNSNMFEPGEGIGLFPRAAVGGVIRIGK